MERARPGAGGGRIVDPADFEAAFGRYFPPVYRFIARRVGPALAEDLAAPSPTVQDNAHVKGVGFKMPSGIDTRLAAVQVGRRGVQEAEWFRRDQPAPIAAAMSSGPKFAECMRSHGISGYPDPIDKGAFIQISPGPDSGIDTSSPRYQAARKACLPLLPNGGP